ncbi:MAG: putative metal-dependent hydrolase [Cryomorphaceae bacterium]|jgi:predicted metal-dependent hydrolase
MNAKASQTVNEKANLVVRKIGFSLEQGINPVWNPKLHEWSHMVNGASLTMPYLEPFLIRSVREAAKLVTDDCLKEEMRDFNAQEGQHFQHHRRYNDMLKSNGYPELAQVEEMMVKDYARLQHKSLKWRLAYTAGFETMTVGVTEWLINERNLLFSDADANVASFILWHMVEETEHKNVAIDLYNHLYGDDYWSRAWGLVTASLHVVKHSRLAYIRMLKKDGLWNKWRSRTKLWSMVTRFLTRVAPAMLRALRPSYHPSKVSDPVWVQQWVSAYAGLPEGVVPLLNTNDPDIAPQFV